MSQRDVSNLSKYLSLPKQILILRFGAVAEDRTDMGSTKTFPQTCMGSLKKKEETRKTFSIYERNLCTTTVLSKLLTSCLTAVKKHWIRYYDTIYERDGIN